MNVLVLREIKSITIDTAKEVAVDIKPGDVLDALFESLDGNELVAGVAQKVFEDKHFFLDFETKVKKHARDQIRAMMVRLAPKLSEAELHEVCRKLKQELKLPIEQDDQV